MKRVRGDVEANVRGGGRKSGQKGADKTSRGERRTTRPKAGLQSMDATRTAATRRRPPAKQRHTTEEERHRFNCKHSAIWPAIAGSRRRREKIVMVVAAEEESAVATSLRIVVETSDTAVSAMLRHGCGIFPYHHDTSLPTQATKSRWFSGIMAACHHGICSRPTRVRFPAETSFFLPSGRLHVLHTSFLPYLWPCRPLVSWHDRVSGASSLCPRLLRRSHCIGTPRITASSDSSASVPTLTHAVSGTW